MSAPEPGSWTIAALDMGPPHRRRRGLRRGGGRRARHRSMARREGGCWVAGRLRPGTAPRRAPRRAERAAGAAPRVGSANHDRGINGAPLHIPPARRWMPSHSLMAGGRGMWLWLSRWSRRRFTRGHSAGPPCEPSATYRSRTTPGNGFGSRGDSSASRAFILRTRVQR